MFYFVTGLIFPFTLMAIRSVLEKYITIINIVWIGLLLPNVSLDFYVFIKFFLAAKDLYFKYNALPSR